MTRNTEFLINTLLTLLCYFALCAAVIAVTHSGYCRCGACEDCRLRRDGDEETTMTQATVSTIWPRVALFNYFAVPMPPQLFPQFLEVGSANWDFYYRLPLSLRNRLLADKATAVRLPLDWTSSRRSGEFYDAATSTEET